MTTVKQTQANRPAQNQRWHRIDNFDPYEVPTEADDRTPEERWLDAMDDLCPHMVWWGESWMSELSEDYEQYASGPRTQDDYEPDFLDLVEVHDENTADRHDNNVPTTSEHEGDDDPTAAALVARFGENWDDIHPIYGMREAAFQLLIDAEWHPDARRERYEARMAQLSRMGRAREQLVRENMERIALGLPWKRPVRWAVITAPSERDRYVPNIGQHEPQFTQKKNPHRKLDAWLEPSTETYRRALHRTWRVHILP